MASLEFPVSVNALFVGKSGTGGSFPDSETGEMIDYREAYGFDFEGSDGVTQRLTLRGNKIDKVAEGFDVTKAKKYVDQVRIEGVIVLSQGGGRSFFQPAKIVKLSA